MSNCITTLRFPAGLTRRNTLFFKNHCGHPASSYVGSLDMSQTRLPYSYPYMDIYLYDGLKVCVRTGDEAHEYMSLGTIFDLLMSDTKYVKAIAYFILERRQFMEMRQCPVIVS